MDIGEKDGRDPILSFRFLFTVFRHLSCNPPTMSGAVCIFISILTINLGENGEREKGRDVLLGKTRGSFQGRCISFSEL